MKNFFIPNPDNNYKPHLLSNGALMVYTLLLLLFNSFSGLLGISQVEASSITNQNIITLTNEERTKYGVPVLTQNSQLSAAALAKANNMFQEQYWDHFGPNGETPWQFIKEAGYKYVYAGENLAKGFKTAEGVVQAWMASPTHRENLLSGNYKEIGIAAVSGNLLGENVVLVVQMFGNRTTDTAEAVKQVTVEPTEDEIKTIKITYPEDGDILNDPALDIKGQVNGVSGSYTVALSEDSKDLGEVESKSVSWTYDKKSDWSEGEHKVIADLKGADLNDDVSFTIDSRGPVIKDGTLSVEKEGDKWKISVEIEDDKPSVSIVSGSNTLLVTKDGSKYSAEVEKGQLGSSTIIVATDKLGNTTELDITALLKDDSTQDMFAGLAGAIQGIDVRSTFNILFAAFILALLGTEAYVYIRKGMLAKKAGNLLTIGIWWVLLVVGIINGFRGVIS